MLKMTMHCDHTIFRRFSQNVIPTSIHTRCSYGHNGVFHSMTVLSMCLKQIFLHLQIIHTNIQPIFSLKKSNKNFTFFL